MRVITGFVAALCGLQAVSARVGTSRFNRHELLSDQEGEGVEFPTPLSTNSRLFAAFATNVTTGSGTFAQPIDHKNPELGTFEMSYWWSSQYYAGPGSPIILFTPGESNASAYSSYLTTNRTTGVLAKEIGAAVINIEHRYWGNSSPYNELTTDNMKYLTLENSISDFVNFAQNVKLPFDPQGSSQPAKAPWVMVGGSYSGALSAWTAKTQPGTFWAYSASSAPVQAIDDYWQYFYPSQVYMAKNCSTDISRVIDHVDDILLNGSEDEILSLKTQFGLQDLEHNDDFASVLENGPWLWQGIQFYQDTGFFAFCDALEGVKPSNMTSGNHTIPPYANHTLPGPNGVGLPKALDNYAGWVKNSVIPGSCASYGYDRWTDEYDVGCYNTYDATSPLYTDVSLSNVVDRQWMWFICNEPFGYWQDGAPADRPSIVSRLVDAQYWKRQCSLYFPPGNDTIVGVANGKTEDQVNTVTGGWDFVNSTRLLHVNGDRDPWRTASMSSDFRPGGPLQSTPEVPVVIVPGGYHCSDLVSKNGQVNAGVQAAIDKMVAQLTTWVGEFVPS